MIGRELDDAVAQADLLGPLAGGGQENLRRGGMGVLLEEVVLDLPGVVVAEPVSQFDLVQGVLEELVFAALVPRPGELVLIEDPELHRVPPSDPGVSRPSIPASMQKRLPEQSLRLLAG